MEEIFDKDCYELFDISEDEEEFLESIEDTVSDFRRVQIDCIVSSEICDYTPCTPSYLWKKAQEVEEAITEVVADGSTFNIKSIEEIFVCGIERFYSNLVFKNFKKIIWNVAKEYFETQYEEHDLDIPHEEDIETPLRKMLELIGVHSKASEIMEVVDTYIDILKKGVY